MPGGIPQPVTPPLNLLDEEGGWFSFPTFASYIEALRAKPAATNCALLVGHTTLRVATLDDLEGSVEIGDRRKAGDGCRRKWRQRMRIEAAE